MSIIEIANQLAYRANIAKIIERARSLPPISMGKKEISRALDALREHLSADRHQEAVALASALFVWDADVAVARMRRSGILRASRYGYRSKALIKVLDAFDSIASEESVRPDRLRYIHSVRALLSAAEDARRIQKSLLARLINHKKYALKSLLLVVNEMFVLNWQANHEADSDLLIHWGSEEMASAFSYILNLMREEVGFEPIAWQHVDDHLVSTFENIYSGMLVDAAKLCEFREIETLIDGLPYEVEKVNSTLRVFSTDENFEKSVRLGYIQSDMQMLMRTAKVMELRQGAPISTVEEFIAQAFKAGMGKLVNIVHHPMERLVFMIPDAPQFFEPIAGDQYFNEEVIALYSAAIESFLPEGKDARSIKVSENLEIADVIKVQRLFSFISCAFHERLKSIESKDRQKKLRARSMLPVIPRASLLKLMGMVIPIDKAEECLHLLTLDDAERFIDIQYRPIIQAGDQLVIAPALLYKSNLPRNIVVGNQLRNTLVTEDDPMEDAVVEALKDNGFLVEQGLIYDIEGERETDILCWREGHLFVFECKNSFHPCSAHELRTSYERIKEGEEQLDIRKRWLKQSENQDKLYRRLGWNVPTTEHVHTGIITANRMFSGLKKGDHPVRQAFELINVIRRGVIGRPDGTDLRFWQGMEFSVSDLIEYLEGGNIVDMQYRQLQPFVRRVSLGATDFHLSRYWMDAETMARDAETAYDSVEHQPVDDA
ncbi:NERD domain-containing protein [Burkholderia latens]|uniref:endonuclease n=1 Tax=Burkholderia latens TaxID=488446 RepID=UPI0039A42174